MRMTSLVRRLPLTTLFALSLLVGCKASTNGTEYGAATTLDHRRSGGPVSASGTSEHPTSPGQGNPNGGFDSQPGQGNPSGGTDSSAPPAPPTPPQSPSAGQPSQPVSPVTCNENQILSLGRCVNLPAVNGCAQPGIPVPARSFRSWCEDPSISLAQDKVIRLLLALAGTGDCALADARLKYTTSMTFSDAGLTDLSPLASQTQLCFFRAKHNRIADISAIQGLRRLKDVDFEDNLITDISPLRGLKLRSAVLSTNRVVDTSALSNFNGPTSVGLDNNLILRPNVQNNPGITTLSLGGNPFEDLSGIRNLAGLKYFIIKNGQVKSLAQLAPIPSVVELHLEGNQIQDISPLNGWTSVNSVWLDGNQVASLPNLSGMAGLAAMYLPRNNLSDIRNVATLRKLVKFFASDNFITEVSGFANLSYIAQVDLIGNQIVDVQPFARRFSLSLLRLGRNRIADVSSLVEIAQGAPHFSHDYTVEASENPLISCPVYTSTQRRRIGVRATICLNTLPQVSN